ncbi:MAG: YfiR family protein [Burkholderiaceae bacterium]
MRKVSGPWRHVPMLRRLALFAALASVCGSPVVRAQSPSGDAAAKAKFTVTLARFVQWPAGALAGESAPLRLCVLHNSAAVGAAFTRYEGEPVAGHALSVVSNPAPRSGACHLLFVDASAARAGSEAIVLAAGAPMLTLGAVDGFLSQGGMVELANVNDALRFDVNLKALRAVQLGISSQALRLAREVRE